MTMTTTAIEIEHVDLKTEMGHYQNIDIIQNVKMQQIEAQIRTDTIPCPFSMNIDAPEFVPSFTSAPGKMLSSFGLKTGLEPIKEEEITVTTSMAFDDDEFEDEDEDDERRQEEEEKGGETRNG